MVRETEYYELLGVAPDATDDQIKRGYKKGHCFIILNADNPAAAAKFQNLAAAYEVLIDPQKRAVYDQHGAAGLESAGGGGGGMDAQDLFAHLFSGGGGLGGFGGGGFGGGFGNLFGGRSQDMGPKKARLIHHVFNVSLEDVFRGKTAKLALQKSVICPGCAGHGGKEGAWKTCPSCMGRGFKIMSRHLGPSVSHFQVQCQDCQGQKETIRDKDRCRKCAGKKTVVERKVLHVDVPVGVQSGHKLNFPGEGDQVPGVEAGDVQFEIQEKPHPRFQRKRDDLFYEAEIPLLSALAGGEFQIEHLDNRWLNITIHPGEVIEPKALKVVKRAGMLSYRHQIPGDLFIHFNVKFPRSDELGNISLLHKVLPPPPPLERVPVGAHVEDEHELEEVDAHAHARLNGADEMDEDGPPDRESNVRLNSRFQTPLHVIRARPLIPKHMDGVREGGTESKVEWNP